MPKHVLIVVVGLLLGIMGCSGSRLPIDNRPDLPEGFPHHSLDQVQQQLQASLLDTLHSFTAKASFSVRTPQQSGSLTAKMKQRRTDSLYMALSPGLGIEAARMLVTPDSFFIHDRIRKQLNYGSLAYAAAFFPLPRTSDDIFRSLLGLIQPDPTVPWELTTDTSYYHLRDASGQYHYTIDPTVWRVVSYEERAGDGTLVERRTYTEYDTFGEAYLPRRVILQRPLDDTNLVIYYRDLTLNPETLTFSWHVGDSVERVLIDELQGANHD